jgi:ADP-ribose pyrophosphatase YjhB (NUDIX family)
VRSEPVAVADLLRWSEALAGVARTGMAFTTSGFERERFTEVLAVAGDIRAEAAARLSAAGQARTGQDGAGFVEEWMRTVGTGMAGYITPRVAIGAIVGDDEGRILLVQRADSGVWLYPTGWADVGYSAAEIAVKEVQEETGIEVEPVRLVMVLDGMRLGFTQAPLYSLVFQCRAVGGSLRRHELECADVGWFSRDAMPSPLAGVERWGELAFAAIDGGPVEVGFDPPRRPVWRPAPPDNAAGGSNTAG